MDHGQVTTKSRLRAHFLIWKSIFSSGELQTHPQTLRNDQNICFAASINRLHGFYFLGVRCWPTLPILSPKLTYQFWRDFEGNGSSTVDILVGSHHKPRENIIFVIRVKNTASECILSVENNRFEVCWGGATDPYGNELQALPLRGGRLFYLSGS